MAKPKTNPKPLVWQGAKTPLLKHLHPLILTQKCTSFVEVFAGSAVVTLTLPKRPGVFEVINDLNSDLINFHRCMIHHAPEMVRLMRWQLNSRELFMQARDDLKNQRGTEIQRACAFWFLNAVSFGSNMRSFGVSKTYSGGGTKTRWLPKIRSLKQGMRRMSGVAVENMDWQRCLKIYDHPQALFFLDPPYVHTIQDTYKCFTLADMQQLRETVLALKGRWIVTVGDTPAMREMWQGCELLSISRARGISAANAKPYAELIITPKA